MCTACTAPKIPQVGGASCVTPSPNCATLNTTDHLLCTVCTAPYVLLSPSNLCGDCPTAMADCTTCTSATVCTACTAPKVVQFGDASCVTPAANCATLEATDKTKCSVCNTGFLRDAAGVCQPCSTITDCLTCTSAGVCNTCSGTKVPQVGGASCVEPSPNCATLSATDKTKCATAGCSAGYFLIAATELCADCPTAMTDCTTCTAANMCTACTAPKIPQVGGASCVTPSPNCATLNTTDHLLC
jgi:hypothetical protein